MGYGIQLYSLDDDFKKNAKKSLAALAKMGYEYVEFASLYDNDPEKLRLWLDRYSLGVLGAHVPMERLRDCYDDVIREQKIFGNKNVVIPSAEVYDAQKLDYAIDFINEFQPRLAADGFLLHYHNHANEFKINHDGDIPFDELKRRTEVLFEIDTYWVYDAGYSPVDIMRENRDRIALIHIKDGFGEKSGAVLGEGNCPVGDCLNYAENAGLSIIVENESGGNALHECEKCIQYLYNHGEMQ